MDGNLTMANSLENNLDNEDLSNVINDLIEKAHNLRTQFEYVAETSGYEDMFQAGYGMSDVIDSLNTALSKHNEKEQDDDDEPFPGDSFYDDYYGR